MIDVSVIVRSVAWPHGVEDEGSVGGLADADGQVAIGTFFLAPLGEVAVEVGFGGLFEEVTKAMFAVGLPLLPQVEGEDELTLGISDGDQGDDGVGSVAFALETDAGAAAGQDEAVGRRWGAGRRDFDLSSVRPACMAGPDGSSLPGRVGRDL